MAIPKPLVLLVLDGLGIEVPNAGNAVSQAKTPNLDRFWPMHPHTSLQASGNYVGLPKGVKGNSEVGHMSIGAGRVIFQEIARIDHEIENGEFYNNAEFKKAVGWAKEHGGRLHLLGICSDGRVHGSLDHLFACLEFCKKEGLTKEQVLIHAFTDGRDAPPKSAEKYLNQVNAKCDALGIGRIASVIGRYYALDRDERWERTQLAFDLIVHGKGTQVKTWNEAITKSYEAEQTDEYLMGYVIVDEQSQPIGKVGQGDTVMLYNYRADRAVQITKCFVDKEFTHWDRQLPSDIYYVGFSNYQKGIPMARAKEDVNSARSEAKMLAELLPEDIKHSQQLEHFPPNQIFPPENISQTLGEVLSQNGCKQLRISESEKYPHVTYFLNCRHNDPFPGEDRIEVPSPKDVATYDLKPEMSTYEITDEVLKALEQNQYDFIMVNFALTDMVAHTGNIKASIRAVEVADECLGKLIDKALNIGGQVIVTADHGNIEELINLQTGEMDTEHSLNPVPFIYITNKELPIELPVGMLADLAPTCLAIMGITPPAAMTGRNLLAGSAALAS